MVNIRHDDFGTAAPVGSDKIFFRDVDDLSGLPNGGIGVTTVDQMFDAILALKGAEIKAAYEGEADTNAFTDAAATVVTEALTDSDFTGATGGLMLKDGAGSYNVARVNLAATGAPGTGNDETQGYEITSQWYDQTNDDLYVCFDATTGAAQWELVNGAGGGGGGFTEKDLEDLIESKTPAQPATGDEFVYRVIAGTDQVGACTAQDIVTQGRSDLGISANLRTVSASAPTTLEKAPAYSELDMWLHTTTDKVYCLVDEAAGTWVDLTEQRTDASIDHNALSNLATGDVHTQYLLASGTRAMSGDLNMGGQSITNVNLVDGLDLSTVESGATADQTPAEIKTAYESNADTNAFTDAAAAIVTDALVDGDFTGATGGLMLKASAGSYNVARVNDSATGAPGTGNDNTQGYEITSQWYDQTNDDLYVCFDASTGAAQWELVNGAAGGGLANVVEDLTPQLGGPLDVNGQEITGAIDLHSTGDIIAELGDAAGVNKLTVRDSGAVEVAAIDSDGNITTSGTVDGRDIATDGTKLDGIAENAIANVVEDTTPQLGGGLDVNGNEITGAIDLHSTGDIIQELGDAAGTNKVSIRDSTGVEQAAIDSDGNITTNGTVDGRDIATDGTKLDLAPEVSSQAGDPSSTPGAVGDINVDTTDDIAYIAADTVDSDDWRRATSQLFVPFISNPNGETVNLAVGTNTNTLFGPATAQTGLATQVDLRGYKQARISVYRGGNTRTGLVLGCWYSTTSATTGFTQWGASGEVEIACPTTGIYYDSGWIDLAAASLVDDVYLGLFYRAGATGNAGFLRVNVTVR